MKLLASVLFLIVLSPAAKGSVKSGDANAPLAFGERCDGPPLSNAQAKWRCTHRAYTSAEQLEAQLRERFPRGEWKPAGSGVMQRDDALKKLEGKPTWWDCNPGSADMCGFWVRVAPGRYIVLEQVLDHDRGNAWIGIGVSTFCQGSTRDCRKLAALAAQALDPKLDFSDGNSSLGPPPVLYE